MRSCGNGERDGIELDSEDSLVAADAKNASQKPHILLILLACIFVIGFITTPANHYRGDPLFVQAVTVGLINKGTIEIGIDNVSVAGDKGQYYYQNTRTGKWYSKYGEMNTLMYAPPLLLEKLTRGILDYNYMSKLRIIIFGAYNIILSLIICRYLWSLTGLYSSSTLLRCVYILGVFYATFAWFYLRSPSFEVFQLLFFTACTYHLIAFKRGADISIMPERRAACVHLLLSSCFLGMLCLAKLIFVLIIPLCAIFIFLAPTSPNNSVASTAKLVRSNLRCYSLCFLLPVAIFCIIILSLNTYKFGTPFDTGYRQWANNKDLFSGSLLVGIQGFLFSPQQSIFTHFPILLFAFIGMPLFWRKYRYEYLFISLSFAIFLAANSKFCDWKGSWGYGPRYLLFVLPSLALPSLFAPAIILKYSKRLRVAAVTLSAILLTYSTLMQVAVNSFDFFASDVLVGMFDSLTLDNASRTTVNKYLQGKPRGHICWDLIFYKIGARPFPLVETLRNKCDQGQFRRLKEVLNSDPSFAWNYYLVQ